MQINIDPKSANLIGMMMAVGQGLVIMTRGVLDGQISMEKFTEAVFSMGKETAMAVSYDEVDALQAFWAKCNGFDIDNLNFDDPKIIKATGKTIDFMKEHGLDPEMGADGDS